MEAESITLETKLGALTPIPMSSNLLDRLEGAMQSAAVVGGDADDKIIQASSFAGLSALEETLRGLEPYGVPEDMISRLDQAMSRWHEEVPVEEKIVPIHRDEVDRRSHWLGLRSVAAVALLGAGVAFLPTGSLNKPTATTQRIPVLATGNGGNGKTSPAVFTPKDARASLVSANDRGVVWTKKGQPLRCLEVHLNNELRFVNEQGERLIIEQPKTEVRFTPVKFD